jgi:hypothetical protein
MLYLLIVLHIVSMYFMVVVAGGKGGCNDSTHAIQFWFHMENALLLTPRDLIGGYLPCAVSTTKNERTNDRRPSAN